jgi:hypothetical protein
MSVVVKVSNYSPSVPDIVRVAGKVFPTNK